ncbi:RNA polymerase sporulation sigma factor SigH [Anaeromicropila populeti]|uniref:RNA polymerase sigma factor SigS n=1 Tax=Anaeromicropila populeti TaxID=37658 RepID=A0A1I6HJK6_9FIRM|nr:RNA polymerase sporulation sigma factor SigH [Anaeromicropila populeti]SFR54655.1 RNA polymerase, sigma 30 subunit, SigH [Anaeromicropila populeti]
MQEKKYKGLKDEEIIKLIRGQDNCAMDYLLDKYKYLIRQKATTLFLIGGDKDDLIQEGMIGLYKAIRDFNDTKDNSFFSFAELCISRQMYTAIKQSNRKKNMPLNTYVSLYTPAFGGNSEEDEHTSLLDIMFSNNLNPEEMVIDKESTSVIEYELGRRLSAFEQEVLMLYLGGLKYLDIAGKLGKEPKSVDNALQRIKSKLSQILDELK